MRIFRRKNQGIILILFGILCFMYFIIARLHYITFAGFFGILAFLFILLGILRIYLKENFLKERVPKLLFIIKTVIIILIISFISIEALIINASLLKDRGQTDYIIILGAMVRGDTPSLILQERMDAGMQCIKDHPDAKIILSGGKGPGENISEAEAMEKYLIENGIDKNRLIKEENSKNTLQNLKNSKAIIDTYSPKDKVQVTIVTSEFHMFRSKMIASRLGLSAWGFSANTARYLTPTYYIREYFGVIKSFVFDRT